MLPCEEYAVPPFEGLRITVTGLPIGEREAAALLLADLTMHFCGIKRRQKEESEKRATTLLSALPWVFLRPLNRYVR